MRTRLAQWGGLASGATQYGVGDVAPTVTDLDDLGLGSFGSTGQITEADADTVNTPELGGSDTQARWFNALGFGTDNRQTQLASHIFAAGGAKHRGRLFARVKQDSTWYGWYEVYHANTILGTVSEDSGTPTGAVIERGSNANGEYVRFADGTQIATNGNAAITTAPAAFSGTITKIDSDKLWVGQWF